ncbi:MAG TPA: calcium-binding protein [Actinomycetota bacterium]|nr:calcium-binding protein [Actinomycetota bacterium]
MTTTSDKSIGSRARARTALAVILGAFLLLTLLSGDSFGLGRVSAQPSGSASPSGSPPPSQSPTGSPTGSPGPTGPAIKLLNPNPGYDPLAGNHPVSEDIPQISDLEDADEVYHVVAVTSGTSAGATVEALWTPDGGSEQKIGAMQLVAGTTNAWELFWAIPDGFPEGTGTVTAKLFQGTSEVAKDSVAAEIDTIEETVEITWPTNGGQLGFFKSSTGPWRTTIEGMASLHARNLYVFFSTTAPGSPPVFTECASVALANGTEPRPFEATCPLPATAVPSQVTSVAVVAAESDNPLQPGGSGLQTQESADAHSVRPYLQDPTKMTISLEAVPPATPSVTYPAGKRRVAGDGCIEYFATVLDHLARPVQGANIDFHLTGPGDDVGFGDNGTTGSGERAPDQADHPKEELWDCTSPGDRFTDQQGDHETPEGADVKHVEAALGTGVNGGTGVEAGQFRFGIFSPNPGMSAITAWVDEMPLAAEADLRPINDDVQAKKEASATIDGQFLAGEAKVTITPSGDASATGACVPFTVTARGGKSLMSGVNVDVHATGPTNDLDFCDPPGGSARNAPQLAEHDAEDAKEASHPAVEATPAVQHTEGQTDEQGDFLFGLTSPLKGDTTLEAWIDGEAGSTDDDEDEAQNDDLQNANEVSGVATMSWANSAADAKVRFVNPSGYGAGGDVLASTLDENNYFHVVTRVDVPTLVQGVDILISSDGSSFSKLGTATRVGQTDTYGFSFATATIDDGGYTLRAQIIGTQSVEDRAVDISNSFQTIELSQPTDGSPAAFVDQQTSVVGTASAGATGVLLYYTTTGANEVRGEERWTECGSLELAGGDAPQPFTSVCKLQVGDSASQVSGVAALATTCDSLFGCEAPLGGVFTETGDAHRVFGFDSEPKISITPTAGDAAANSCQRVAISTVDGTGEPLRNINIDVHIKGPAKSVRFCDPEGGSTPRTGPNNGGHTPVADDSSQGVHSSNDTYHTEGKTGSGGRLVVGIKSPSTGSTQITAWVDESEDDVLGQGEGSAQTVFSWGNSTVCTVTGTKADDRLVGDQGADRICGRGGDDVIVGKGGDDVLLGGRGNDVLRGGRGNDKLKGSKGSDAIFGQAGRDGLGGASGNDEMSGGAGRDNLRGGKGNDSLNGGGGRDRCAGGRGRNKEKQCE